MGAPKIAVVTGASGDLGIAITEKLLLCGYRVLAQYHSNLSSLQKLNHANLITLQGSLDSAPAAEKFFAKVKEIAGHLDLLVNLVGPFDDQPILEVDPQKWEQIIALNLHTVFHSNYYARELLQKGKGQVIHFTYAGAENIRALPNATAYAAAKAGVAVLTKSLAAAYAASGVRVNAVAPGLLDNGNFSAEKTRAMENSIPLGRLGQPQEVAEVVSWLADSAPPYLTGATVAVAGGWEF